GSGREGDWIGRIPEDGPPRGAGEAAGLALRRANEARRVDKSRVRAPPPPLSFRAMAGGRRITVLVVAEDRDTCALYVDTLLAADYMVHGVALQDRAEPVARATRFDIVVFDSPLDAGGLEVAERLAAPRPRA